MPCVPTTLRPSDVDLSEEPSPKIVPQVIDPANEANHAGGANHVTHLSPPSGDTLVSETAARRPGWRVIRRFVLWVRSYPGYMASPSQQALEGQRQGS